MKINCKISLSLFIAILWQGLLLPAAINGSMIGEGPYTTYATLGSTAGVSSKCLEKKLRSSSHAIRIPTGFPIGSSVQHKAYVSANGIISFDKPIKCGENAPFPTNWPHVENSFIVAPYWSESDIRSAGSVCYEVHDDINSSPLLRTVSDIIHKLTGASYNGYWLMVAEWRNVHPFPHGASFLGQLNSDIQEFANKVNSYQAIVITDYVSSYALFTYRCNDLQWYGYMKNATIGTNTGRGSQYNNYNTSNFKEIVCINMPDSEFYSIVYQLSSPGFSNLDQTNYQECSDYYYEDISKYGSNDALAGQAQGLPPCPCSGQQAQLDGMWREIKTGLNCYDYKFPSSTNATQRCCYSTDSTGSGALKTAQSTDEYGTNMIVYHENAANVTDTESDEYFRSICCSDEVGLCSLYYARRPPNDCTGYTPSSWGWGYGDPHMKTFDGSNYTFNNLGEFYILKLRDWTVNIQGRTSLVSDTGLSSVANANATQFTSIAFRNGAHTIEFNATSEGIRTYYNQGRNITSALYNVGSFLYDADKAFVISRETTDTLLVAFACDIWASVSITSGVLHFRVSVPAKYMSKTFSLLGNYNGNPNVDLVMKNGNTVDPTQEKYVYYFAENWRVESSSHSYFIDPNPTPISNFVPVMVSDAISSASREVLVQCGYDSACIYDAVMTGSLPLGLVSIRVHNLNIADLAKLTNFPPNITGDPIASFAAASGAKLSYNFSVTDTDSFTVVLANTNADHIGQLNKLSTGSVNGATVEDWEYSFEWGPSNTTNFSITFIATDSSSAASILEVKVQICYCLNGGSCSNEHIKDLTSSTTLLACDCTADVWDGEYCQSDANGCDDCSCYDGVSCTDNVSPLSGLTCGACPAGLFKGDERCIDNSTSNNNNNNNNNGIDGDSSNVIYMCSSRLDKVSQLSLVNGSTQYSCTGGYKLMVSSIRSNATACEASVYDCTGGSCINGFTDVYCNCPSHISVTNGICAAKDDCFLNSLTPTIDCNDDICPLYDGGYQCSNISNSFAKCTTSIIGTSAVSSSTTTTASHAITTSNGSPTISVTLTLSTKIYTTTTIPDPGQNNPDIIIVLILVLIILIAIVICIVFLLMIIVYRSNGGPNRIMIGLHRRVHVEPAGFSVDGRELQVIQNPHVKREGLISMGILEGAKAMTAVATVGTVSNALEVVSLDGSEPEDW